MLVDAAGQPLPGAREGLRWGVQTFLLLDLAGPSVHTATGAPRQPSIKQAVAQLVAGLAALRWQPTLVVAATWPGEAEVRRWQLADGRVWTLAAETVARELVLLWPTLAWPGGAPPRQEASAKADWRLPEPGMLHAASAALDVTLSELRVVGGEAEREAARRVGAGWIEGVEG
jgi:hypothetical protein